MGLYHLCVVLQNNPGPSHMDGNGQYDADAIRKKKEEAHQRLTMRRRVRL